MGIRQSIIRSATRSLLAEPGEDVLRGLRAKIHDITHASSMLGKAKEIWGIICEVKNVLGISGIFKALKASMSWSDWLITGVTITAQLLALLASDGAAIIGEIAIEVAEIGQLVEDALKIEGACGSYCEELKSN